MIDAMGSQVGEVRLVGVAASPGIAFGKAVVLETSTLTVDRRQLRPDELAGEIRRVEQALEASRQQLLAIKDKMATEVGLDHAYIFDAHLMMLDDRSFVDKVFNTIRDQRSNAEWAIHETLNYYRGLFEAIDDAVIRDRGTDVTDVANRVLINLSGRKPEVLADVGNDAIVVSHDLAPSHTAGLRKDRVRAFVTQIGSRTSHSAIMARALEIPAVVGVEGLLEAVQPQDPMIVDGLDGVVIVRPDRETFRRYLERQRRYKYFEQQLLDDVDLPAETRDGYALRLAANIELPREISAVHLYRAEGIGLYRTEFLFMNRPTLPSEDEQYEVYRNIAAAVAPHDTIIRTLDIGGDKFLSELSLGGVTGRASGLRAIRLCLAHPELFKTQLRAILRAGHHGNVRLMFPLISGVAELRQAKALLTEAADELRQRGAAFDEEMAIGIMIEVPSAAVTADLLAREVDFFSIGSNDLIQYSLAIDRMSEEVAYLYEPLHPAVLRMIHGVIQAGHREGIPVGMCGEMAADPVASVILLGMGIDMLSMNPVSIPRIKRLVRSISYEDALGFVEIALGREASGEAREHIARYLDERVAAATGQAAVRTGRLD